jgi:phosphonate transport system ATP-binding protein
MDMITELARSEKIPVLVNLHDVQLAREYADRIIGLSDGEIVFDGPPEHLDQAAQDHIYTDGTETRSEPTADDGNEQDPELIVESEGYV